MRLKKHKPFPGGHVVGIVRLDAIVENARSKWAADGMYHWMLKKPIVFPHPVAVPGQQGLFPVPTRALSRSGFDFQK
jgi:hypothetical protein